MNEEQGCSEDRKPSFKERLRRFMVSCGEEERIEAGKIAEKAYLNSKKEAEKIQEQGSLSYLLMTLRKQVVWIVVIIVAIVFHCFGVWVEIWRFLLGIR